ncbi:MAG: peptidase M3, partial [Draconibacterium sp.]
MNGALFAKIKAVYEKRNELGLDKEQMRATEKYYEDFVRNGANLNKEDQVKLKKLNEQLSTLSLQFGENLLAETNKNFKLVIDNKKDLAGLPDDVIARAADDAKKANEEGKWVFTLAKPSLLPFLQFAENRALREKLYRGYFMRGDNNNANDNKEVIKKMIKLRQQRANLLGFDTHAAYIIDVNMAKTPEAVYNFLDKLMTPAMQGAKKDLQAMQAIANESGAKFKIEPWDWWFYAEKLRMKKYNFDESKIKPYFTLDNAKKGIFYLTNQLFGIQFNRKKDWPTYHEEAEVYEVLEKDGSFLGVLYMDFHPRDGKRVGAWSTSFRDAAYDKDGKRIPAVGTIVMNFTRPADGKPAFLSFDEVTTFFHEFGHALHGLFTDGPYERTAGDVARDFVEFPSQVMENWAAEPSVMKKYAKHYQTGEVIPDELIKKMQKASTFNEGFISGEYLAAAYLDMFYHDLKDGNIEDIRKFEQDEMKKIGLIPEILPRYRSTYFAHIFDGGY